jgi:hypothetical protein
MVTSKNVKPIDLCKGELGFDKSLKQDGQLGPAFYFYESALECEKAN